MRLDWASRHIVLIGLPGAGKYTVGPLLAAALRRPFHDIDAEIVRRAGWSIARQFAEEGEAGFRRVETVVTRELLAGPPAVLAVGGGWVVTDANWESARDAAVVVHLRVTPATAFQRIGTASRDRPLLDGVDPGVRIAELEVARRERYARADVEVDTEMLGTEGVVRAIESLIDRSAVTVVDRGDP